MAKGALYWRLKDEQTGKWTYKKATIKGFQHQGYAQVELYQEEQ